MSLLQHIAASVIAAAAAMWIAGMLDPGYPSARSFLAALTGASLSTAIRYWRRRV